VASPAGWGRRATLRRVLAFIGLVALVAAPVAANALGSNPNDPLFPKQWGMRLIGAPTAWATGTGQGVTIAVVDTGVDFGHPDLAGKVLPGYNYIAPGSAPQDDYGHGTHVAGIAAADTNNGIGVAGVAPGASIMPVKVLDSSGGGSIDTVAQGIDYAADHGAQVINLSLGSDLQSLSGAPAKLTAAVEYAWSKGSICVLAAGNGGLLGLFGSGYSNQHALVVTALTPQDTEASYATGVGSVMWGISAPGGANDGNPDDDIVSTYWDGTKSDPHIYGTLAGTSMAAPHVSGAAAILRGLGLSPQQTIDRLLSTAKNLGSPSTYGAGQLDVTAAVAGLGSAPVAPPTTPAPPRTTVGTSAPIVAVPAPTGPPRVTAAPSSNVPPSTGATTTTTAAPPPGPAIALSPQRPSPPSAIPPVTGAGHRGGLTPVPVAIALAGLLAVATALWLGPRRLPRA
jgi:serine protease